MAFPMLSSETVEAIAEVQLPSKSTIARGRLFVDIAYMKWQRIINEMHPSGIASVGVGDPDDTVCNQDALLMLSGSSVSLKYHLFRDSSPTRAKIVGF